MNTPAEDKSRPAEEYESALEARDDVRTEAERRGLKSLNQGMDSGGYDASHPGIKWGPTFRKRRKAKAKKGAKSGK